MNSSRIYHELTLLQAMPSSEKPEDIVLKNIDEKIEEKNPINISVIIPVYNDSDGLKDTLNSLVSQDYPTDSFEIIVADNGSTDDTSTVIKEYIEKYPKLIYLVVEDKIKSSYAARNKGIKSSRGSMIAFIDADMTVGSDWLSKIDRSLKKHKYDCLACNVEIYYKNMSIYEIYNKMCGFPIKKYVYESHFAPTCCLVVRKKIFKELCLFDMRLISSGDHEFGTRMYRSGHRLYFDPDIVMRHPARSSLRVLYNKYFRIGRGHKQISVYYPDRYSVYQREYTNPLRYLPQAPWNFSLPGEWHSVWIGLSSENKIKMYLIEWILRLATGLGYFYENYRMSKSSNYSSSSNSLPRL